MREEISGGNLRIKGSREMRAVARLQCRQLGHLGGRFKDLIQAGRHHDRISGNPSDSMTLIYLIRHARHNVGVRSVGR